MGSKRGKKGPDNEDMSVAESVSIAIEFELERFLADENETEIKFPSFLSAKERHFIHTAVVKFGLKSKSRGKGVNRFITIYKRMGSTIIQTDAKLALDSTTRCSITDLLNAYPMTSKEKDDLTNCTERERCPQVGHKAMGQLNNGVAQIPNTQYNKDVLAFRSNLPVYIQRQELMDAINNSQVVVIAGETGSGKTTQIPQLVMEQCQRNGHPCRILCTQPRRISAVSVAERVAYERNEKIGQTVGYQIRLESRVSPKTILTYCTNGVLLRTLMGGDGSLATATHIFVDEVHERDKFSDFLLIALRDALLKYRDLRVVLMSATMDTHIFSKYFNDCPIITIPGRLFEVQRFYLEDILTIIKHRTKKMIAVEKELKHRKKTGKPSYWSHLEAIENNEKPEKKPDNQPVGKPAVTLDSSLQADMNEFLNDCFVDGSLDSFCQVLYMYMSEGIPVDCQHDDSGQTGLMAAAHHGLTETAQQIIQIGADPLIADKAGKTAYNYAIDKGHTDCANYLSSLCHMEPAMDPEDSSEDANNFLLDVYQHSVSEESIDHELMLALIKHIHLTQPKGSILVFLPGYDDIVTVRDMVQSCAEMNAAKYQIFTLHSNMQTADQKKVFHPLPNQRKIIVSTNIAETSITIDDVVYVVDSCKVKEKYYESSAGICSLQCVWTSKACAAQRAGRAGRTQPGKCYHMCSRRRFRALPQNSIPEILRVPLQELCLHTKLLAPSNTPIAEFLARALEPPSFLAVRNSMSLLKTIGALTPTEDLTEIGQHLLDLTVEPKLGKMLLYACVMKCLDPVLTIVCALASKEPFQISQNPENRKLGSAARKEFSANSFSDHMALLRAFQAWQLARANGSERSFCSRNLICGATMETIVGYRSQLLAQLRALSLVKARGSGDIKDVNSNSEKWHVVKAVLVSGLYPSLARVDRDTLTLRTNREVKVAFHPSSTLHRSGGAAGARRSLADLPSDWVVFEEISRAGRFCFIRCNTLVTPLTVALFGGPLRLPPGALTQRANPPGLSSDSDSEGENQKTAQDSSCLTLDDWTTFTADSSDSLSIYLLRQKFCALIVRRMLNPAKPMSPLDEQVLQTMVHVLGVEEKNVGLSQPSGIGQRPKPLLVDYPSPRSRNDFDGQYQQGDRPHYNNHYNNSNAYGSNHYQNAFGGYHGSNGHSRQQNWRVEGSGHGFYGQHRESGSKSPLSPSGGSTLLANIEKYTEGGGEGEEGCRYFIVRVDDSHEIDKSQATGVWHLNSNLEKKIAKMTKSCVRVLLFFSCGNWSKFVGYAELGESTAGGAHTLSWLSTSHVPHHLTRNIINSYSENRRVWTSRDGQELCGSSGRALVLLFEQTQKKGNGQRSGRPIQKQPHASA